VDERGDGVSKQALSTGPPEPSVSLEAGIEAFESGSEFQGPVESLDGHECNDHFAQIYETRAEKFEASVPFVRHGLDRDERVMYVVDESTEAGVKAALRDAEIDVDAALQSGALSFHTVQDTYLQNGSFDTDEMIDFYGDTVSEATEEYEALRIVAEMTWVGKDDTSVEQVMEYEQRINELFEATDSLAICQYNRERFAPAVIRNVVRTHPHLIYDGAACHNVYYTPPEEFFGEDAPARENERMLRTLRDRTAAKAELQQHEQFLRELYRTTSDPDLGFEEKLDALFELGCDQFGLEIGGIAEADPESDLFEVKRLSGEHDQFDPEERIELSETYCRVFDDGAATSEPAVADSAATPDSAGDGDSGVADFGVHAYLGAHLRVDGGNDRMFFFVADEPRDEPITDDERAVHRQMAQWVKYELGRRQREQELRERTEHLSALVETTPECIKTVAEDGTLLQMNPAGLDMVEAPAESTVTGSCVYDLIAPEHRDRFREFNERICDGDRGTLEFDVVGLEGTRRHMETHAAPLRRPDGTRAHVALTRDVTEQKERQRALKESNERLEQFAYAASHDLQEPLRMVTSYLQLLETRYGDAFDEDGEEFLEFAIDGADRMREMIDGLLKYSRVEARGNPLEPVELDAVVDDVRADLQIQIDETDAEITTERLPRVEGDGSQLRQVFQNLLDNAITYSGDEPPRVHVATEQRGEKWVISIRDDGIGIDPDDQERIFAVFDRLHSREEYDGTGLGLALCQRIIERHGGDIRVESEPGDGTTFSFTLPAA